MSSIFDAPENYSWDNIRPISKSRLRKLKKRLEDGSGDIIDFRPLPQQADKSLPPIDEELVTGIVRQIEDREGAREERRVGEQHLEIISLPWKPTT